MGQGKHKGTYLEGKYTPLRWTTFPLLLPKNRTLLS